MEADTLAAARVVWSMSFLELAGNATLLEAMYGTVSATDVLQPVNGNQGALGNPNPPSLDPSTRRGADSLYVVPQHLTSFGPGRDRR